MLVRLLADSQNPEDRPRDLARVVAGIVKTVRTVGYAERDPNVEPKSSGTIAVPIRTASGVLATIGITYFRSAVPRGEVFDGLVRALQEAARQIESNAQVMLSAVDA